MQNHLTKLEVITAISGNQCCLQHYLSRKSTPREDSVDSPFARARARKRKGKDNFSPPRTSLFFTTQTLRRGERSLIKLNALADKEGALWEGEQRETTLFLFSPRPFLFFLRKEVTFLGAALLIPPFPDRPSENH